MSTAFTMQDLLFEQHQNNAVNEILVGKENSPPFKHHEYEFAPLKCVRNARELMDPRNGLPICITELQRQGGQWRI